MSNIIIGISGPSGSGKSLLSKNMCKHFSLKEVAVISEDGYYKDRPEMSFEERHIQNYDHPNAFEHQLLAKHIEMLKDGMPINTPLYDYSTHSRKEETICINPCPVIILEGILLLADEILRKLIDIKIYIDAPLDMCLVRKIHRDCTERRRDVLSVMTQYITYVRPMYFKFIEPSKEYADIIVPKGGGNEIAIDIIRAKITELTKNQR